MANDVESSSSRPLRAQVSQNIFACNLVALNNEGHSLGCSGPAFPTKWANKEQKGFVNSCGERGLRGFSLLRLDLRKVCVCR